MLFMSSTIKAMGKEAKPVLLKQNILEKNRNHHPELSEKDSRTILQKALYESDTFICDKPSTKPNYWVLVEVNGKNSLLTIEISETKTHHEIVGWRFASEKSVNQIKNRAEREGGQVLVTESNAQGASGLHALPSNSGDTVTPETEKSSEAAGKVEEKAGEPEVMSLDQFLASRGVAAPISDFMIDKLKIPHGLTARQEQQFHKEAEAARNAYHNKRDAAIEEYERLVAEGKIRKPTIIEEALRKAHGHPDNPSVQAARRVLKKRGIDWRTGKPLAESVVKQNLTTDEGEAEQGLKFSIIGERGARNLNDGEERLHNRALAEKMLDEGIDAKTVKLATGWERWHDGKWRMELPDLQVKAEDVLPDGVVYTKGNTALKFFDGKLHEYVKAPELFRAYPQLWDMHLVVSPTDRLSNGKCYGKTIVLELNRDFSRDNPADMKSLQGLLIHEVQHAIQHEEGFPRGSNPGEFAVEDERAEGELEKQRQEITRAVRDFAAKLTTEVRKDAPWNFAIYDEDGQETLLNETQVAHAINDSLIRRGYTGFSDLFQYGLKLDGEEISWDGLYDENGNVRLLKDDVQRIDRLCREYHNSLSRRVPGSLKYYRTAGEAEARNATKRSQMTEAEKRGSLLDETGDVLPDDLIYLNNEGTSAMTPLRRTGDPNTAENSNQLRDGDVPHAPGFLEWAGLKGNRLYADYEFLYGRHSQYFSSPEEARAAVELVLAQPEKVQDLRQNLSFVGMDEKTGKIYRIEISPKMKQRYNHIRSVFEITPEQYRKIKLPGSPVLQLSPTDIARGAAGRMPSSLTGTVHSESENSSAESQKNVNFPENEGVKYSLAQTEQRNPIEAEGETQRENQEKLDQEVHEVHHDADVLAEAKAEIDAHGGIGKVIEKVLNGRKLFTPDDVGQRMGQLVMNSDEYGKLSAAERSMVSDAVIQVGTQLGQALRSRRSLTEAMMSDPDALKATLRLITDRTPDADKTREHVKEKTGVDPLAPPDDLVNDKDKLDQVLRELSAGGANLQDKIYEYWINAILSGPQTHAVNVIGNTANAAYELTAKRFAEACINLIAKKKDSATFGEFREMWKHLSFSEAWNRAVFAFNHEMVSFNGKYQENSGPAISGKTGRLVRLPSRLLNAADQFSRTLIQPVETAAMAYREGVSKGLAGKALQDFIERQIQNPKSNAFKYGKERAQEMVFQEAPGAIVRYLIAMKNEPGIKGTLIRFLFPFIKTPSNILRQGLRKSPLGALSLAGETLDVLRGKRGIDNRYIQHAAEQILAWSAFLMLKGFDSGDDEDDLPILTGSSATPGSGEALFKGQNLPAYSIRIGDTWYSYKRIEPLATGLTIIADAIQELKEVGKGKSATAALKKMLKGTTSMIAEKSYLDTLNQVNQLMNNPEREVANWSANFLSSWMPAAVRQTVTAMDDTVRDFKMRSLGTDWYNDFFHTVTSRTGLTKRAPKIDYFGREIRKEFAEDSTAGDVVFRLLTGSGRKPAWDLEAEDQIIANWNLRHPDAAWWPNIPNWKFRMNKQDYYFDTETYPEYARKAGELARKQVKRAIRNGYLNVANPREKDIDLMKKILMRARKETRQKMFSKAREIR